MEKVKFIILAIMLAVMPMQGLAHDVDLATARATAMDFMRSGSTSRHFMAGQPRELWTHVEPNELDSKQAALYIIGTDRGFVIVAGDDRARSVLAYSDYPLERLDEMPQGMRFWLTLYKKQVEALQAQPDLLPSRALRCSNMRSIESVAPMLTSTWGQTYPYNLKCPMVEFQQGLVGCSAIALAQVMRYWQYPSGCDYLSPYRTRTLGILVPELDPVTFNWSLMLDSYKIGGDHTYEQLNAATTLLRYVGQAERMDYKENASDASEEDIMDAIRFFGFDTTAHVVEKSSIDGTEYFNDSTWAAMLQDELSHNRPVIYCGYSFTSDTTMTGHAFNVDGYDAEADTYHVNFGWRGTGNGYFAMNAFNLVTISSNLTFNIGQLMIVGVEPPPVGHEHGFERGDVNHDGAVDITDVSCLIEFLLDDSLNYCSICSDVLHDGRVDIADLAPLIDHLLHKNTHDADEAAN